jgi:DNA-dependent protein kinase catalytic subunit
LLEWVKEAQHQNHEKEESDYSLAFEHKSDNEKIAWYPQKKIDRMKDKLEGKNSAYVMMKELNDSQHKDKEYFSQIKLALVGPKEGFRHKLLKEKKRCLEVEEQVDFLIDHASDPNLLGRLWIGWTSYV